VKTQIIAVESHDDLISLRDRMSWAKTPRILLVIPAYVQTQLRQVDLKILQRHATSLGAQLGVVTRQRRLRMDAVELKLPVFESTSEAQRHPWPERKKKQFLKRPPSKGLREKRGEVAIREAVWRANPIVRIGVFIIGVLAVLLFAGLFLPRAQVELTPVRQNQSLTIPVNANPLVTSVFITGSIPAKEKTLIVEGVQSVRVTGSGVLPQSKAKGQVMFQNLTEDQVVIPQGTVVRSGDIRFVTTEEGVVEEGIDNTIELPIEALDGGFESNLDAETINVIEGRLGLSLAVTNPEPTSGGRERSTVQATESDRDRAKALLLKTLEAEARTDLLDQFNSDDTLFDDTFALSQVLYEEYDLPSGAAGTQLTLSMRAEFSILYADAADISELALLALNGSIPSGFMVAPDGQVKIISDGTPMSDENGSVKWSIQVERTIIPLWTHAQISGLILGLDPLEAESKLNKEFTLLNKPSVKLDPRGWPLVPIVPFRVDVIVQ